MMTTPIMFLTDTLPANVAGGNRSSVTPWPATRAISIPAMLFPVQVQLQLITSPRSQDDRTAHVPE